MSGIPARLTTHADTILENMPAYAVAHMRTVNMGPSIEEDLQRIDATLEPFAGRFLVHGGRARRVGGAVAGTSDRPRISRSRASACVV